MKRLINAEALKERIITPRANGKDLITELIDSMPTIDAVPVSELHGVEKERDYWMDMAHSYEQTILRLTISAGEVPVRHGKWIRVSPAKIYECSECGQNVCTGDIECYRFCHQCGARMDVE